MIYFAFITEGHTTQRKSKPIRSCNSNYAIITSSHKRAAVSKTKTKQLNYYSESFNLEF